MDPANRFAENDRRSLETHWSRGNVESVSEKLENLSSFFDKNCLENYFWQKLSQHAAQLTDVLSIDAKILAFRSLLQRQDPEKCRLPSKKVRNLKI